MSRTIVSHVVLYDSAQDGSSVDLERLYLRLMIRCWDVMNSYSICQPITDGWQIRILDDKTYMPSFWNKVIYVLHFTGSIFLDK